MNLDELIKLVRSNEAPNDYEANAIWLHNKIIEKINYDLWTFREQKADTIKSSYASVNHIMSFPSLKRIDP